MRVAVASLALMMLVACDGSNRDRLTDEQATAAASGPDTENFAEDVNEAAASQDDVPAADRIDEANQAVASDPNGPSFQCAGLLSRVEDMVCSSPELARMDLQVAESFARAMAESSGDQQERLTTLGKRHLLERNACGDPDCVAQAYRAYQQDIDALMGIPGR